MAAKLQSSPEFRVAHGIHAFCDIRTSRYISTTATKLLARVTSNTNRFIAEIPEGNLKPEGGSESDELHGGIGLLTAPIHQPDGTIPYQPLDYQRCLPIMDPRRSLSP